MTYDRVHFAKQAFALNGAAVSHSAELVRGHFLARKKGPPHPPIVPEARLRHDGHLLPKGRRDRAARANP
jgi:hypothetical protein